MALTQAIIKLALPSDLHPEDREYRGKIGLLEGWVSVFGNFLLFGIKLFFGLAASSIALIADAFHTLSDVATSAVVIFGFNVSQKPADKKHPFGHGRAETIATFTIAILMAVVSIEFFRGAVDRLFFSESHVDVNAIDWLFISIVTLTAAGKAWMAHFAYQLGDLIDSDALRGDAVHHKSDVYTTLLVIVALIGVYIGFPVLDGVMGIAVAIMILHSAYGIARDAIDDLLGKPASPELIQQVADAATSVPGARQVHDVIVHTYGADRFISLHVEIDDDTEPPIAHNIADNVEHKLGSELNAKVVTHIDPVSVSGQKVDDVSELLGSTLAGFEGGFRFQDLRVVGVDEPESILFEIPVAPDCQQKDELEQALRRALADRWPRTAVIIEFKAQMSER